MATPFTFAVVLIMVGLGVAWGTSQAQLGTLKEKLAKLEERVSEREKHGGTVDTKLASMEATLRNVDANVEELLNRRRAATAS